MLNFLKEYFTFTRGERNGIIVLLLIIIMIILLPFVSRFFRQQNEIDFSQFQKEIEEFEKQQARAREKRVKENTAAFELFSFDPNEITEAEWRKLGVNEKTARTIINYRGKGGYFDEKQDLLRIYGFDTAQYELLEPYMVLDQEEEAKAAMDPFDKTVFSKPREKKQKEKISYAKKPEHQPKEIINVELNSADTAELVKVRGIGPTLSKRIIKYRNKLGGFVNVEQLLEVYGMDSTWFEIMKPSLSVNSTLISKIDINHVLQEELEKHPYFGKNIAKAIVNYRQQHGFFRSADDLKKIYLIDEKNIKKIEPYIGID
ncbi:MAG TPA: helix-hairpin-helix domain-containing protein [Chitinophagales bacterium]|nr:helix-hairpin-helix domain-containing protein [Chitinophagales bacterium]